MYDVAIIGAGPGGISCAKEASALGLKTILIERDEASFGGTCLNVGCIPAKYLINNSKHTKSWEDLSSGKSDTVDKIKTPLVKQLQNQKIEIVWANAKILDAHTVSLGEEKIEAKNIVIATGSSPKAVTSDKRVLFAQELLKQSSLGNKFLIIGAGYIGVEMASLLHLLGKDVLLIEKEARILPFADESLAKRLRVILEKKGIKIKTSDDVANYNFDDFDMVLSAVGRAPNTEDLGLDNAGIELNNGWIKTDNSLRTNVNNIYACGDVTGQKALAYVAEYQGRICAQNIAGKSAQQNLENIPECVFSSPQLAQVGLTAQAAKANNIEHRIIRSNFLRFSCAYVYGDTDGFMQLIVGQDDRILGAGIISNFGADLANALSICIRNNLKVKDLSEAILVHPVISEILSLVTHQ